MRRGDGQGVCYLSPPHSMSKQRARSSITCLRLAGAGGAQHLDELVEGEAAARQQLVDAGMHAGGCQVKSLCKPLLLLFDEASMFLINQYCKPLLLFNDAFPCS